MTCPYCHQDAPTIVRGVRAYCTVCGAPRSITTAGDAVNVAGQPGQVGGAVASVLGTVVLVAGLLIALVLGSLANWLFAMTAAVIVGGGLTLLTLLVAVPLMLGGRRLRQSGNEAERAARERAVFALAAQKRGVLTVREVARALAVPEADADALLTSLVKRSDSTVSLEVDDNGVLSYRFSDLMPSTAERVRVAEQPWQAPARVAPQERVAPREKAPRVIDAELIDEDEEALVPPQVRRALR